ncbi:UNVERIFIED_CONTAM: hypothetical protein PYX00_002848 [Menopon gallinae]|uniref:Uncharacterized protein n=1 Tax=Menopon gallinae TaxID=328185 RepID=A0AAW2HY99_9NEOP
MGITGSRHCRENIINPEFLSVITLTDSMVQRLPLDSESSSPLDREAREQNIDDFWKDRMGCMENAFEESMGITEGKFNSLEKHILGMAPPVFKPRCSANVTEVTSCFLSYPNEPENCEDIVKQFKLCLDTTLQDESRRSRLNAERVKTKTQKKKCKTS